MSGSARGRIRVIVLTCATISEITQLISQETLETTSSNYVVVLVSGAGNGTARYRAAPTAVLERSAACNGAPDFCAACANPYRPARCGLLLGVVNFLTVLFVPSSLLLDSVDPTV
jgi:hypothetical protein